MGSYANDRQWSDRFIPAIKQIIGPLLMVETPHEIDCEQAADLMLFTARNVRIAARLRRPGYAERYPYQFTMRCMRDNGMATELAKIVNGFGDWFFYGHADQAEAAISLWWLIDLASFRAALIRQGMNGLRLDCGQISNNDGTYFKWFDIRSFPEHPPLLIASSMPLPARPRPTRSPFDDNGQGRFLL